MGREVRRVPKDWEHPKYTDKNCERYPERIGRYIPLREWCDLSKDQKEWDQGVKKWEAGFVKESGQWVPKEEAYRYLSFDEYGGGRPSYANYMPRWEDAQKTHYQMYENTTEGTPKSPVMASPEELARWLADNNVSSFGSMTATYEQWLNVCRGAWAPSLMLNTSDGSMMSGVQASRK